MNKVDQYNISSTNFVIAFEVLVLVTNFVIPREVQV